MTNLRQKRFMSMYDTAVEGSWIMDHDGKVEYYNSRFYNQFDLNTEHGSYQDWLRLVHPDDRKTFERRVEQHLCSEIDGQRVQSEFRVRRRDGTFCWIDSIGIKKRDEVGEYMVGSHRDITEKRELESSIRQLAYYDKVSGLPNDEKLRISLRNRQSNVTLVHIYLDKILSYSNQYGEQIIHEVITRMMSCLSVFDGLHCQAFRASGEMFSVIIYSPISEFQLASACQELVARFRKASKKELYAGGLYIGVYQSTDLAQPESEIINWASKTCEYAQRHEESCWAICNPDIKNRVERFFYVESQLKQAIEDGKITIYLQPIICNKTHQIDSFEALARWTDTPFGAITPAEFIAVAERKGLINTLGKRVLQQACGFITEYNMHWKADLGVNVNVSSLQLLDGNFPHEAAEIARTCGLSPQQVRLEITESVLSDDNSPALYQIERLKQLGFLLVMDDFGSAHASVTGFFKMPFNHVKIARELVKASMQEAGLFSYLQFLANLCNDKGVSVTLEGVESREMMHRYVQMNVERLQGFYFSHPVTWQHALAMDCNHSQLEQTEMQAEY